MEDSRQNLRTECRGGGAVVGFGLPAQQQAGRIWPCISRDVMRAPCIVKPARGARLTVGLGEMRGRDGTEVRSWRRFAGRSGAWCMSRS